MSAADEDTELRDLLVQTLDKNGVLGKIKAELRASIFLALEAQEQNKTQNPLKNTNLQKFVATDEGRTCIGIVREFLNHFNLDYTSAVFNPEANVNDTFPVEGEIHKNLNLTTGKTPILAELLRMAKSGKSSNESLQSHQTQFLRSKFESFDRGSTGSIDRKDVTTVIGLACPLFRPDMLERFVAEEMKNKYSSSVTFEVFINMFQKLFEICHSITSVGNQTSSPAIPLRQMTVKSPDTALPPDSYYMKQSQTFHQVPSSPTPMSEVPTGKPTKDDEGIPARYLMPTSTQDTSMDVAYDDFFDSQPGTKATQDSEQDGTRARTADSGYPGSAPSRISTLLDTPAVTEGSAESSVTGDEWPNKKVKNDYGSGSQHYEDDFNSEQSISEEIQDLSNIGDDLLQSSDKEESLDLTEDRTVSEIPHADYMEDIRHG